MQESFKKVLIPVDFSINTEVAVCKALEIIDTTSAKVHLLHICKLSPSDVSFDEISKTERHIALQSGLNDWKESIEEYLPGTDVSCWIEYSQSVANVIVRKAKELQIDLIVIGKNSSHAFLPFLNTVLSDKLTKVTGSAILTVKHGALHSKIRSVVVPITDNLPYQKMKALSALCKRNKARIVLVAFRNKGSADDSYTSTVLKVFEWLKASFICPVEYAILEGKNKPKAILKYVQDTDTDMLLVYPESETKISWVGKCIYDVLSPASKVQILSLQPESQ